MAGRLSGWLLGVALVAASAAVLAYEPPTNYMLQCMGCHTPDGPGEPGRVPNIKSTLAPFALNAAGRRFLIQVPALRSQPSPTVSWRRC